MRDDMTTVLGPTGGRHHRKCGRTKSGSPALSMMRGRHPAHRSSFSREFSIVPGRKSADFIESAGEPKKWFSRTFDDAGPPPGTPVFFFQGILGRSRPEIGRLHRKCGRTEKVTHPE